MIKLAACIKTCTLLLLLSILLPSNSLMAQRSISLDKQGKVKRLHFFEGETIDVRLLNRDRVTGTIGGIYDSSFVVNGRKVLMSDVNIVYTSRKAMQYTGTVSMAAGAFYLTIDMINNLFNYQARQYVVSNSVWAPAFIAMSTGAIVYYFSIRRSKVHGKNNFRIYDTTPIPIENLPINECEDGVTAKLKKLHLDGCNWVLQLADSNNLEPINLHEFLSDEALNLGISLNVKIQYKPVKSVSICMIGPMVEITCLEIME